MTHPSGVDALDGSAVQDVTACGGEVPSGAGFDRRDLQPPVVGVADNLDVTDAALMLAGAPSIGS